MLQLASPHLRLPRVLPHALERECSRIGRNVRIGRGAKLGVVSTPVGPLDPLSIVSSVSPFFFLSADVGVTISSGVSGWADQTGNGCNASQPTSGSQPTYSASDSDFGGRSSIIADGVDDYLDVAWNPPAPGTQPIWFFAVFLPIVWTSSTFLFAGSTGSNVISLFQTGVSPAMVQSNTTLRNSNNGAVVGVACRAQVFFSASAADHLKLGSSLVNVGTSAGNTDPNILRLFSRNGGSQSINAKLACIGAWAGEPMGPEKTSLDSWIATYYGPGVLL